jgi:hypothetical protein
VDILATACQKDAPTVWADWFAGPPKPGTFLGVRRIFNPRRWYMSSMLAGSQDDRFETGAEELRREIVDRAQRMYERSLRLRRLIVLASLIFSLGQSAYSAAMPAEMAWPLNEAVIWGVPILASLLALSLEWSCRLHRDQSRQQYAAYLYKIGRRAVV